MGNPKWVRTKLAGTRMAQFRMGQEAERVYERREGGIEGGEQ